MDNLVETRCVKCGAKILRRVVTGKAKCADCLKLYMVNSAREKRARRKAEKWCVR